MIVVDMDIPESCQDCRAYGTSACDKLDKHRTFSDQRTKRHKDCPIVGEIEQEPKTGHWMNYKDEHQCSRCKEVVIASHYMWDDNEYEYCPYCGARMVEEV